MHLREIFGNNNEYGLPNKINKVLKDLTKKGDVERFIGFGF